MPISVTLNKNSPAAADAPDATQVSRIAGWLEDLFALTDLVEITTALFPVSGANGGLGAALPAAGYLKGGAVVGSQTVPIPIADGGTNATTAAGARSNLGTRLERFTKAGLPAAGEEGRVIRVTNDLKGIWLDNGTVIKPYRYVANVRDFGAIGDGVADDTVAIQAAIDAARAIAEGPAFGSLSRSAVVEFPIGSYSISHLDCTGAVGLELIGKAAWGVTLYADRQASAGKAVVDLTGSIGCRARGILVSGYTPAGLDPAIIPTVGWLIAASSAGDDSTAHIFDTCGTEGKFSKGALYIFGGTNHVFIDCGFSQALKTKTTIFIGNVNVDSVTSLFKTIHAGTPITGEITFIAPEIHGANDATATGDVLRLYDTYSIKIYGGVCDASGDYHVLFNGTANRNILFSGIQFYSEAGTATDVFYTNNSAVQHLVVEACDFENAAFDYAAGGLFSGTGASAQYPGLRVIGIPSNRLLGSFLHYAAEQNILFADNVNGIAAGATRYLAPSGSSTSEANARTTIVRAGVLVALRASSGASPGGSETYIMAVMQNGSPTALTVTLTGADTVKADTTNRVVVAAGDLVDVRVIASAGAATTGGMSAVVGFIPGG